MPRLDLLNYEQVKAAIKGVRWVFHLAYGRDGSHASRITIEGTQHVVEAAIAEGCECVIILSSAYVFGHPHATVDESYPYRPVGGEYGKSKARMERWCLKRSRSSGTTRIVVLNPTCVYGPGGKTYSTLPASMVKEGNFCWIENGEGIANYTFIENLLDALLLAATCERAHGERYIINDGAATWREFLKPLLGPYGDRLASYTPEQLLSLHHQNKRLRLWDVARVIASDQRVVDALKNTLLLKVPLQLTAKYAPSLLHKARASRSSLASSAVANGQHLPAVWLADLFGCTSTMFCAEKAHRLLGWKPRIDLIRGQELTVIWLKKTNLI
jgi:nucleoside-diphosphate-sugar epimerase